MRFWKGFLEKIGGYQKNGTNTFTGKARSAKDWQTLALQKLIALGTHLKLMLWDGGTYYDITPIRLTATLGANPFSMTNTSTSVSVTHTAHGGLAGDYVTYSGASAGGGITINGEYTITSVTDADHYVITHSAPATSTTTGGGASVSAAYQIHVGIAASLPGYGYGASTYGASTYGTARSTTNFLTLARLWSLDTWGEDLIACPRDGGIYVWDATSGASTRAVVIGGTCPTTAKSVFVSEQNRQLVVLGPDGDLLRVKWSANEDYTDFTATASNTAGSKLLEGGTELLCAVKTKRETVIFTQSILWAMHFDGPPYTFSFEPMGSTNGIRGPHAAKEHDGKVYWMGKADFWVYDSAINLLTCDVLPTVFDDIDDTQGHLIYAGANQEKNEIWWLYPSNGASECDRYVLFNVVDKTWAFGTLARTVFVGDSKTFNNVYALGPDGYLYDHEYGVNADGAAINAYAETGDMEITPGDQVMIVDKVVPDFAELSGTLSLTLKGRKYPKGEQLSKGPYSVTSATEHLDVRITARQIAIKLEVSATDANFRVGTLRINVEPDGGR